MQVGSFSSPVSQYGGGGAEGPANPRKEFAVASCAEIKAPIIEKYKDFVLLYNKSEDILFDYFNLKFLFSSLLHSFTRLDSSHLLPFLFSLQGARRSC
jgi:hypothetical protein